MFDLVIDDRNGINPFPFAFVKRREQCQGIKITHLIQKSHFGAIDRDGKNLGFMRETDGKRNDLTKRHHQDESSS